jgi:hypothetical protein
VPELKVTLLLQVVHIYDLNTQALLDASKEVGLEVNPEKTKYRLC